MSTSISQTHRKLLLTGIEQLGLSVSEEALNKIERHLAFVNQWRSKINLISIQEERELITHHALDSLVMASMLAQSKRVLDIGTGAGFPGMQLASVYPEKKFTLLDSRQRRIEFLRLTATFARIKNIEFVAGRVEDYAPLDVQKSVSHTIVFDTLIARAVTSLTQLFQLTRHLHHPGQRLIAMKGVYPQAELDELEQAHGDKIKRIQTERLKVPYLGADRHAVTIWC